MRRPIAAEAFSVHAKGPAFRVHQIEDDAVISQNHSMNLQQFLEQRRKREEEQPRFRQMCVTCYQPVFSCFCRTIKPFDPGMEFAILNHPIEMRRRIATGRMSHLCLKNSHLIVGHDYSLNDRVNDLIDDPTKHCVTLYPGPQSINLSDLPREKVSPLFPQDKKLVIFVIDGTWATARQTAHKSLNIRNLPRICFTPPGPSNFRVRKQPDVHCYSTIEAIHHTIELLRPVLGLSTSREHDHLLEVFNQMVERQLKCLAQGSQWRSIHREPLMESSSSF